MKTTTGTLAKYARYPRLLAAALALSVAIPLTAASAADSDVARAATGGRKWWGAGRTAVWGSMGLTFERVAAYCQPSGARRRIQVMPPGISRRRHRFIAPIS